MPSYEDIIGRHDKVGVYTLDRGASPITIVLGNMEADGVMPEGDVARIPINQKELGNLLVLDTLDPSFESIVPRALTTKRLVLETAVVGM